MKELTYYVSLNYNFSEVDMTLDILQKLGIEDHKVLYGVNFVRNTGISDCTIKEIHQLYRRFISESKIREGSKDVKEIAGIIGNILSLDKNRVFLNENEIWEYISALPSKEAFKYEYLTALLLIIFTDRELSGILTADKIRFCGEKDISFSTMHGICGEPDERNLYIWFEIDPKKDFRLLKNYSLQLIVTDNTDDFNDYLYYLGAVEYNNFNLVIGGENIDELMSSEMLEICSEEFQFVKYRPELKKFM